MITKEEFKEYIRFIVGQNMKQEAFIKALEDLSPDNYCNCFLYSEYEDKFIELIEKDLGDTDDTLGYFLYDLDYIYETDSIFPFEIEENVTINSLDDLYDYIIKYKEE
jgi:hypothetical protein